VTVTLLVNKTFLETYITANQYQDAESDLLMHFSFSLPPSPIYIEDIKIDLKSSLLKFDPKTAVEAVLYIANKLSDPSFHRIAKLLYFADRLHLARYGRFICGDRYIAMQYGPVPSGVYELLKSVKNSLRFPGEARQDQPFTIKAKFTVSPLRSPDLEWLSPSEVACLDEAIADYGNLSFAELTELSHDAAWRLTRVNEEIDIEAIVASIGNPDGLLEHLQNPNP
jgi:uncharacterized phage-associated protein